MTARHGIHRDDAAIAVERIRVGHEDGSIPGDRQALRIDEVPVLGNRALRAARRVDPYDPSLAVECLGIDDQDLPRGIDRDAGGEGQKASGRYDTRLPGPGVDLDDGLPAEIGDQDVARIERAGEAPTGRQDENADEYAGLARDPPARVLAGLRYLDDLVYQILRGGDMLEESSVYQDILRKGIQQGMRKGERHLVIRLLELRLGKLSAKDRSQIEELSTEEVERLAEALLDFSSQADLNEWLTKVA